MSFQPQYLVLFALILLTVALVYYLQRGEERVKGNLQSLAEKHNWQVDAHPRENRAYVLKGQQGEVSWELELYRGGRSRAPLTLWKTSGASIPDGPILIGADLGGLSLNVAQEGNAHDVPRPGWELLAKTPGMGVYPLPYPLGLAELDINPADLTPQNAGSPTFQERFKVLGCSPSGARRILTPEIERQLLDWPQEGSAVDLPVIIADRHGLSVRLNQDKPADQPALIEGLVKLGLDLAHTVLFSEENGLDAALDLKNQRTITPSGEPYDE